MSKDMKVRCNPKFTKEEMGLITIASKLGGETPAGFVRRSSLSMAHSDIKRLSDLNDSKGDLF